MWLDLGCDWLTCLPACHATATSMYLPSCLLSWCLVVLCSQVHRGALTYALRPNSTVVSDVIGCIGGRPDGRYGWNCSDLPDGTCMYSCLPSDLPRLECPRKTVYVMLALCRWQPAVSSLPNPQRRCDDRARERWELVLRSAALLLAIRRGQRAHPRGAV